MNKKVISVLVMAVCVVRAAAQNQVVTANPLSYYSSVVGFRSGDKIFRLDVDINNDGRQDILLSKTVHAEDGFDDKNDVPWEIFLLRADGNYATIGKKTETGVNYGAVAGFPKNRYWIGHIPEINRYGVLYLICGRGEHAKCQLQAVVIEGEAFKEMPVGEPVDAETGYEQLLQRFATPPTPAIQELNR